MIFVTGGTGLVGAHLLYQLVSRGEEVKALRRETSELNLIRNVFQHYGDFNFQLFEKITWVIGDVLDFYLLIDEMSGVDYVYHCAAFVSFDPRFSEQMVIVNEQGTANMVEAAKHNKVKKFCHVSSIASLGKEDEGKLISEESFWQPEKRNSIYSITKFRSEMEVWRASKEGLNVVVVNPSVILGVGEKNNGSSKIFSLVKNGLKYYTQGKNGYVDVKDVVKAMLYLMDSEIVNERFLLNGGNLSYKELFTMIANAFQVAPPQKCATPRLTEIAWRLAKCKSVFSRSLPQMTKSTARSSQAIRLYSGNKYQELSGNGYRSLNETINEVAASMNQ